MRTIVHRSRAVAVSVAGVLAGSAPLSLAIACAALFGSTESAATPVYPSRPVTIVVPYNAGGPTDTLTRIVAERMRASLGQPVIIDNVGGAAGRIGTDRVARAAPDGYTLMVGSTSTHVVNGAVFTLNYDVVNNFEPVSLLAESSYLIVARKTLLANNLKELIAWLTANPDKASQGTTGMGGTSHLVGVLFQKQTGTRFQFVPYRGIAMQDLVAGNIDLMFASAPNSLPQVRAGAIKAYAVAAKRRLAEAPDIPTSDEAGLPGFHVSLFHALWAPKAAPKSVIAKLNAAVVDALADPAVRKRLADIGEQIFPREQQTPEALATQQKAEIERWWPVIKDAGIKAQ
jgi:tripartite-type tricarboxylate transporter receptor subunit TctC